ncbi:MAG: glycerate kinase [bacterium]|nr:glycerate kinase [bacterium]MDT8396175.1 glycerate kinase [bacterium]
MERSLREDALEIFLAGVRAVEPGAAVMANLALEGEILIAGHERIPLTPGGRVFVVGAGKAGAPMAGAVEKVLGDRVYGGLVVVKYGHLSPVSCVTVMEAAHPVPDEAGLKAASDLVRLLDGTREDDLVICLLSGGGSALLPCPAPPVTLSDKQMVTSLLLRSGAGIGEINCIRKHLSLLKGGGLARLAHPARVVTLILSDVVGDPLDVIASGPTVGDPTTFTDALAILDRYGLAGKVPGTVLSYLGQGAEGKHPETPGPDDPEITGVINLLIGTNTIAVQAAGDQARELGYNTTVLSTTITGETRDAAAAHAAVAREIFNHGKPLQPPACALSGGETTVTIKGTGKGGRNQEFALAAALGIDGQPGTVILSGGTDGTDGPTDAAGAVVDGTTVQRAKAAGLDALHHLDNNDAYPFFEKLGDLVITGPTLTNVMDLRIVLVGGE